MGFQPALHTDDGRKTQPHGVKNGQREVQVAKVAPKQQCQQVGHKNDRNRLSVLHPGHWGIADQHIAHRSPANSGRKSADQDPKDIEAFVEGSQGTRYGKSGGTEYFECFAEEHKWQTNRQM